MEDIPNGMILDGFSTNMGVDAVDELWCQKTEGLLDRFYGNGSVAMWVYRVNERVMRDYHPTWPIGQHSPWFKRISFIRRADGMSREEFSNYWRDRHGPLALKTHGAVLYIQNLITDILTVESPQWDGIVHMNYWSLEAFLNGHYPCSEDREIIAADVAKFMSARRQDRLVLPLGEYIQK